MYKKFVSVSTATFLLLVSLASCSQTSLDTSSTSPSTSTSSTIPKGTSKPASGTPAPSEIQGWSKFEGNQVELQLPNTYKGGDLAKDIEVIAADMRALGADFEPIVKSLEQNPNAISLWAFDSEVGPSGNLTNVNIVAEKVLSAVTLDAYLDAAAGQLPPQFKVVGREMVQLDQYEAGKLTTEFSINGVNGKQLVYVVKQDNTVWVVTYSTGQDEFEQRVSAFEKSINTFYIQS